MIVIDASHHGSKRGNALPLFVDLDRTTLFLHDASVHSLDELLDPKRGETSPHPFYVRKTSYRADMVTFLRSLEAQDKRKGQAAGSRRTRFGSHDIFMKVERSGP